MSCAYNTRQNPNIKVDNKSFDFVVKFKYLGTSLTDENSAHEEIKSLLLNVFY
jgi:hypothetical protein